MASSPAGAVHRAIGRGSNGRIMTRAPGASDDVDDSSYNEIGSVWVDTTTGQVWISTDETEGAARWLPVAARKVKAADQTNDAPGLASDTVLTFPVTAGAFYGFKFVVVFRSTDVTVGGVFALEIPSIGGTGVFAARASIPTSAGQTTAHLTASDAVAIGATVLAADMDFVATIEGVIRTSANGSVTLRFRPETSPDTITIRRGSYVEWSQQVPQ